MNYTLAQHHAPKVITGMSMGLEATPAPVYRRKQIRDQHSVSLSRRGSLFWKILFHTPVPGFYPRAAPDGSVRGLVRREELCFFLLVISCFLL